MGIFDTLQRASPRADVTWRELDERWYSDDPGAGSTFSGFAVTPDSAKRTSAVFACTSKLSEIVASLPRAVYRRLDDGSKKKAREHPLYRTIRHQPNPWQTPMDFFGGEQMRLGLRGGSFARIVYSGRRVELWPHPPSLVTVEQLASGRLRYEFHDPKGGRATTLSQDEVLHVRDLPSEDGLTGQARAVLAREAIALAAAGEAFAGGVFKNDASGRLVLTYDGNTPNQEERDKRRDNFQAQYAGWRQNRKALHLYGNAKVSEVGRDVDGGFIVDPRKYQVADVARFWGVPGWLIGLEEKSTSWGTGIEQQLIAFVNLTVKAWTDRWAQAMSLALLDESEQDEYFIEFDFRDLLRGDIKSRFDAYRLGREIGMYSPNDLLRKENEAPRPGGDVYQDEIAGAPGRQPAEAARPAPPPFEEEEEDDPRATGIPAPLLADAAQRLAGAEHGAFTDRLPASAKGRAAYDAYRLQVFDRHRAFALKTLTPLGQAFALAEWQVAAAADRVVATGLVATAEPPAEGWLEIRRGAIEQLLAETLQPPPATVRAA
jgi:HK97 family phage portal protein